MGQKVIHNVQKKFWGTRAFFRRMGHLTSKINKIFFITNSRLNIFVLNDFFGKSVFSEETAKNCCGEPGGSVPTRTDLSVQVTI